VRSSASHVLKPISPYIHCPKRSPGLRKLSDIGLVLRDIDIFAGGGELALVSLVALWDDSRNISAKRSLGKPSPEPSPRPWDRLDS
jgi:hypothetical protein